jgi:DNA mismatch repair protein MutS
MGGKSTYLRQVALVVYLAQIGSYVPAIEARIGLADRIFARIGAHDDLAAGHSTFLLEMAETAAILRLATPRSLVLLDEIGRGTTSSDGQAIARAVAEHIHEAVGARTLFATHYYELARAAEGWPGAVNIHVRAEEHGGQVVFLYRIAQGIADKSFALHVARMAGMPEPITLRAADLLAEATEGRAAGKSEPVQPDPERSRPDHEQRGPGQKSSWQGPDPEGLVGGTNIPAPSEVEIESPAGRPRPLHVADHWPGAAAVTAELLNLDLASTTPIEALNVLYHLQQRARSGYAEDMRPQQPTRGHRA